MNYRVAQVFPAHAAQVGCKTGLGHLGQLLKSRVENTNQEGS